MALGIKGAAAELGLAFTCVTDEEFGLLMPASFMAEPKVLGFVDALVTCVRRAPAALLKGYNTGQAGRVTAFAGPALHKGARA